jgi:Rrf2 family nitric oxide-sensitive transcriptional repressor
MLRQRCRHALCGPESELVRLTNFSDYALRVLMYAAVRRGQLITIEETAERYGISRTHLMKVANLLTRSGYLTAVRGRAGGLRLGRAPEQIGLGDVVRATEPDFALVECFGAGEGRCRITPYCHLRGVLGEALAAFVATLDRYTLADLVLSPADFGLTPV